ncbi:nudE [Acrasis kona]|uniref:NudE n=1 Tax=Acrasis kona TaxID=1008807 RepID=A0AAW2Z3B1_9EUKA
MGLNDTRNVIQELKNVFLNENELKILENINHVKRDIDNECRAQNQQIHALVGKQIQQTEIAEKESQRSEPEAHYKKRMQVLQKELKDISFNVQNLEASRKELERSIELSERESNKIATDKQQFETSLKEELRVTQGLVKLWQFVAPVKWDYNSNGTRGYLISKKEDTIKYFQNPEEPTHESINQMWSLIQDEIM